MAWYDKWAIMVIAAAIGVGGCNGIPWCKMGVAEWAYWVAAIGTVGTLIGTIWIATSGSRQTRKADLTRARLAASKLVYQQVHNTKNTRLAAADIVSALCSYSFELGDINAMLQRTSPTILLLNKVIPPDATELVALTPIKDDCAARIAIGIGMVTSSATLLQGLHQHMAAGFIKQQLQNCEQMLIDAMQHFNVAEAALIETVNAPILN
ncbi:hypothetical protein O0882_12670 [Janthinobacterium sp. SUN073]|uniref:hypothetical protein n=1 Tax=Janthinobacterium sp. SUN073 TaxID=3004102 RepID=UPI0025B05C25|nr:hypothetical protein [Janthinobacterium sp. SUN073]MDN2697170.1 hypothetical protein [Janthinobacterium sp. SUN073]